MTKARPRWLRVPIELAIARRCIEGVGGRLVVDSQELGHRELMLVSSHPEEREREKIQGQNKKQRHLPTAPAGQPPEGRDLRQPLSPGN